MEIHQFLESFSDADAIGYHVLEIQKLLRSLNIKSKIYANNFDEKMQKKCLHFSEFSQGKHSRNIKLIFHHSIYSQAFEYFKKLPYSKTLIFHNISPPEFFGYRPEFQTLLRKGYQQLKQFNQVFNIAIADSLFNRNILKKCGFKKEIIIIPPFVNLRKKFQPYIKKRFKKNKKTNKIIFVSKVAPHKRQDEIIKSFLVYQKLFNPKAKLYIIGSFNSTDSYYQRIQKLSESQPLIKITGKISLSRLVYHYQTANLFLCLSEHEGFAVPLTEAMFFNLPIVAYAAGAVPDTLGSGGILLKNKNPLVIAGVINELMNNKMLQKEIIKNQQKELKRFGFKKIENALKKWIIKN